MKIERFLCCFLPLFRMESGFFVREIMLRIAVIGIIIKNDRSLSKNVQDILSEYGDAIIGRMGVPDRAHGIYAISVIVKAKQETLSALTGKLGRIEGINVKSAVTAVEIEGEV